MVFLSQSCRPATPHLGAGGDVFLVEVVMYLGVTEELGYRMGAVALSGSGTGLVT